MPCRGLSHADIERFEVFHGNERRPLADFFAVSGDAADGQMVFEGNLAGVHWIGAGMNDGVVPRRRPRRPPRGQSDDQWRNSRLG